MQTYLSNSNQEYIILNRQGKLATIQFTKTGYVRTANIDNLTAGKVRDLYAVTVYGAGYYGEFEKVPYWKQAKQLWQNMLKRCYCEKDIRGYFGKVTVSPDWLCFSNFLRDLPKLNNFDKWLLGQRTAQDKYNLDKDLKVNGCKVYSKNTCQFVTEHVNKSEGAKNGKPFTIKKRVVKS